MLEYFTLILVFQLIGEFTVSTFDVPFPGPVVGMVLLFVFLVIKGTIPEKLGGVSGALLNNLSLLFIPAGVGVMAHVEVLGADVWPLSIALVASTLITIVVTAAVMVLLNKLTSKDRTNESKT